MEPDFRQMKEDLKTALTHLLERKALGERHLLVVGVSTSEVLGIHIGKGGSKEVAAHLYEALEEIRVFNGFHLAIQCCEHLNRALVVERDTMERWGLTEVSAIPVANAGGAMAAYAYLSFKDPVLVESIQADAGIDIGDTFIGMHLKPVAVPVRSAIRSIGAAHVTMAITRPKLIGGERAVYQRPNTECLG
jgi:uncharacterized protein (TIGR01440 family)